jgi:hypothetical protein
LSKPVDALERAVTALWSRRQSRTPFSTSVLTRWVEMADVLSTARCVPPLALKSQFTSCRKSYGTMCRPRFQPPSSKFSFFFYVFYNSRVFWTHDTNPAAISLQLINWKKIRRAEIFEAAEPTYILLAELPLTPKEDPYL